MVLLWLLSTVAVHHSRKVGVASSILAVAFFMLYFDEGCHSFLYLPQVSPIREEVPTDAVA